MRSAANLNQTLRRTEWESLFNWLPDDRRTYRSGNTVNEFASLTPSRLPIRPNRRLDILCE